MVFFRKPDYFLLFLLLIVTLVFISYYFFQDSINYEKCPLCDGYRYKQLYHFFLGNGSFSVDFPYYSRIFTPLLASIVPVKDIHLSFHIVNFIFVLLSVTSIYYVWKTCNIPFDLKLTGFFWLLFHCSGIIRFNIYDPVSVDVPVYFFQAVFLLIIFYQKEYWLVILAPLVTLLKESFIPLYGIYFLYVISARIGLREKRNLIYPAIAFALAIITKIVYTRFLPSTEPDINSIKVILYHAKEIVNEPILLFRIIICFFIAYGVFLIGIISKLKMSHFLQDGILRILFVFSLLYVFFDLFAGRDLVRIAFLGFPFVMTLILYFLSYNSKPFRIVCLILSIPFMRIFYFIPVQTSFPESFENFMPSYASWQILQLWAIYILFSAFILFLYNRYEYYLYKQGKRFL